MKTAIMLLGNPGVGKSFILNALIGKTIFSSGFSFLTGKTKVVEKHEEGDFVFIDTPGLNDILESTRREEEIAEALVQYETYKIIYVIVLESGRFRPHDFSSMVTVLEAIEKIGVQTDGKFSVLINKLPLELLKRMKEDNEMSENLSRHIRRFGKYFKIGLFRDITGPVEPESLLSERSELWNFVNSLSILTIPKNETRVISITRAKESSYRKAMKVLEETQKDEEEESVEALRSKLEFILRQI